MTGFVTIGHSSRSLDEMLGMLRAAGVGMVADVRAFPHSRSNPAFNIEVFPEALARAQIGYRHFAPLGGRRGRQAGADPALNALWRVQSFHNYADHALGPDYAKGFAALCAEARRSPAVMCAEALWWRCHRRIVTDYLLTAGHSVTHLMAPGHAEAARLTPGAKALPDGRLIYPAPQHPRPAAPP